MAYDSKAFEFPVRCPECENTFMAYSNVSMADSVESDCPGCGVESVDMEVVGESENV